MSDVARALDALAPLRPYYATRWVWRAVPYGPCPRCRWPAHTLGPNGSPFHPFCWGNADPPSWWDQFVRRQVLAGEWG